METKPTVGRVDWGGNGKVPNPVVGHTASSVQGDPMG